MLILPVTGALFVILLATVLVPGAPPSPARIVVFWTLIYAFVGLYWVALWRSVVRWTARRIALTLLATPLAIVIGAGSAAMLFFVVGRSHRADVAFLMGGGVVPIAWVLATVLIWRETCQERIERLSATARGAIFCPICGYNMTGLHEARCPECGSRFTLDKLVAAQPERDHTVLRDA